MKRLTVNFGRDQRVGETTIFRIWSRQMSRTIRFVATAFSKEITSIVGYQSAPISRAD
jgi:hypothetical protein